jgi:putative membrane protein
MIALAAVLVLRCSLASAHSSAEGAAPGALPWSFEPWVLACLALSAGLYITGVARLWRHAGWGRGVHWPQLLSFAGGWLVLAVALISPLDALGTRLFSAHMIQHELLMIVVAPLLVVGRPLALWAWGLPERRRRALGRFFHAPAWRVPWRFITGAFAAWVLHALALWTWHVPALFEAALADEAIHALQHTAFLGSALLYWWSVLKATTRSGQGIALLSVFTTMAHSGALGALLTFSASPWYATYAVTAPAFGFEALDDQQAGGLVMWIPAGLVYVCCGLMIAARWLAEPTRALPPVERTPAR